MIILIIKLVTNRIFKYFILSRINNQSIVTIITALGCAILLGWNLTPYNTPWILWLSIAILWEIITFNSPSKPRFITVKITLLASLWGFITTLVSYRWLLWLHPLDWIGVPNTLSLLSSMVIWLGCGLIIAFLTGSWAILAIWLDPRRPFAALVLAAIWGIGEVFLAKGPIFWIGLGTSTLPSDRTLGSFAALGGMGTLATIQLLIGWSFWKIILDNRQNSKYLISRLLSWLMIVALFHLMGYYQMQIIDKHSASISQSILSNDLEKVLVWQPSILTREKFESKQQVQLLSGLKAIETYSKMLSIPFIVAPEGTFNFNSIPRNSIVIELLTGGFHQEKGHIYNGVLDFSSNTTKNIIITWLDKRRLVPIGEWIPFKNVWQWSGLSALGGIDSGESSRILFRDNETIAIAICYEISDGTTLATATNHGASWLLTIANIDPYRGLLQQQFGALSQLRTIETGRWMLSVGNTGPSFIVNSKGIGESMLPAFLPSMGIMELKKMIYLTPYDKFGEWFLVLMQLGASVLLAIS